MINMNCTMRWIEALGEIWIVLKKLYNDQKK